MKKLLFLLFMSLIPLMSMASDGTVGETTNPWVAITWIAAIIFFITGIILGCKKVIIVYNDYLDIVISILIFIFPIIMGFIIDPDDTGLKIAFWLVEIGLLSFMLYRTFRFNVNPFAALYALIIKLCFSVIAIFCIAHLGSSHRKVESYDDYKHNAFILAILGAIIALVAKLIKSSQWVESIGFVELRINEDKTGRGEELVAKKAQAYHKCVIVFCLLSWVILSGWATYRIIYNSPIPDTTIEQTTVIDTAVVEQPASCDQQQIFPEGFEEFVNRFDSDIEFRKSHIASGTTYNLGKGYIYNGSKAGEPYVGEFSVKDANTVEYTYYIPNSSDGGWHLVFKLTDGKWMLISDEIWEGSDD